MIVLMFFSQLRFQLKVKTKLNRRATRPSHPGRVCEADLGTSTAAAVACHGAGGHRATPTTHVNSAPFGLKIQLVDSTVVCGY